LFTTAHAEANPIITQPTDFWFEYTEPTQFLALTFQTAGLDSDPQLWLYNATTGQLITENDDTLGLQSRIELELPAGSYRLRAGTCCNQPDVWRDGVVWNISYELSFTGQQTPTTSVALSTTTTSPTTTTTTTTEVATTTTTQPEPTTTSIVQEATTTQPVLVIPSTTPETSSSTSLPQSSTTWELPTTSIVITTTTTTIALETIVPATTEVMTSPPQIVTTTTTNTPTLTSVPLPTLGTTLPTTSSTTSTTDVPASPAPTIPATEILDNSVGETLSDEEFSSVLDELITGDLTSEQITEVINQLLETDITSDQATELATNSEIIATLDAEAATEIFEALDISEVTPEEAAAIVAAVQEASDEVRAAFEESVDVFGGQVDTYVPIGSSVPVKTRRVLIAAAVAAAPAVRRRSI
jgi:hypothetical protein